MALIDTMRAQIQALAEEAKDIIRMVMESDKGINDKIGKNTLIGSNIYNELDTMVDSDNLDMIKLMVNDYIDYIEGGMESGHWVSAEILIEWATRKGLPTNNNFIFNAQDSIYKNGISPRPIFDGEGGVWSMVDEYFDDWADMIFNTLTEHLDNYFK